MTLGFANPGNDMLQFVGSDGEPREWWQVTLTTFLRSFEGQEDWPETDRRYMGAKLHLEAVADAMLDGLEIPPKVLTEYTVDELKLITLERDVDRQHGVDKATLRVARERFKAFAGPFGEHAHPIRRGMKLRLAERVEL